MLATDCAPFLSLRLAGQTERLDELSARAQLSRELLDRAEGAAGELEASAGEDADALRERVGKLRAFADVFAALGEQGTSQPSGDRLVEACAPLALYFDDPSPQVVESAKLWQGVAYRRAGRPERALEVLTPVLTAPVSERIGLWARLERCRALGDRGQYPAALALCLRLGARVEGWFEGREPALRRQAADTVRYVRVELMRAWADKLRAEGNASAADEARAQADALTGSEPYPPPAGKWLALGEAIAGLTGWEATTRPTSQPERMPSRR